MASKEALPTIPGNHQDHAEHVPGSEEHLGDQVSIFGAIEDAEQEAG